MNLSQSEHASYNGTRHFASDKNHRITANQALKRTSDKHILGRLLLSSVRAIASIYTGGQYLKAKCSSVSTQTSALDATWHVFSVLAHRVGDAWCQCRPFADVGSYLTWWGELGKTILTFTEDNQGSGDTLRRIGTNHIGVVLAGFVASISGAAAAANLPIGYLDVTDYSGVDATGRQDSTAGLVAAIAQASDRGLAAFLPPGTYLVSDTVQGEQPRRSNSDCGKTSKSIVVVGSTAGNKRPKIVLADNSRAFGDVNKPRPVVHILFESSGGGEDPTCAFGQVFRGIDIDLGSGNPGAVGIKMDAAQRSALEDVSIEATGAYAGVTAVPGRGMATVNVSVHGGKYGFYLRDGSLGGSLVGVQMHNQTVAALRTSVYRGIAVTGFVIKKEQGPVIAHRGGSVQSSNLVLTNGTIELGRPGLAISNETNGFLHIRNVYVQGATDLVKTGSRAAIKAVGGGWSLLESYTSVPGSRKHDGIRYPSTNVIDGQRNQDELASVRAAEGSPPNFVNSVVPSHIASFQDNGVVSASDFGADGGDSNDDTAALQRAIDAHDRVFLPAGTYRISKALRLRKRTQLLGVPGLRTHLVVNGARYGKEVSGIWKDSSSNFMIVSPDDADATTVISDISIDVPKWNAVSGIHWRAGRNSVVRNIAQATGGNMQMDKPRVRYLIEGNGGGRWYRWASIGDTSGAAEDESNMLLIRDTTEPLSFYGLNPEHASVAMVTIDNARNVRLFGAKTEGKSASTLVIRNSRNVIVSAWMGNPRSGDVEYIRVENSSDIELAGVARLGPSSDPMLVDKSNGGRLTIGSNEYIALYRRGMVDLGAWPVDLGDAPGEETPNQAPVVDAGADQSIKLAEEIDLMGDVRDDDLPFGDTTIDWSMISGPGAVYFSDPNSVQTTATLSESGTYELQLHADDGALSSTDIVTITVHPDDDWNAFDTPENFSATPVGRRAKLSWDDVEGERRYSIQWRRGSSGRWKVIRVDADTMDYTHRRLRRRSTYKYRIRADRRSRNGGNSEWSSIISVTIR